MQCLDFASIWPGCRTLGEVKKKKENWLRLTLELDNEYSRIHFFSLLLRVFEIFYNKRFIKIFSLHQPIIIHCHINLLIAVEVATIYTHFPSVMKQFLLQVLVKLIATQISTVGCLNFILRIGFFPQITNENIQLN